MTFIGEATVTVADGGLGARQQTDLPIAVVGCSSSGTAATPVLISSIAHAIETFGHGPLTEAIAQAGRDREHVLHRAADFHARGIVRRVDAQRVGVVGEKLAVTPEVLRRESVAYNASAVGRCPLVRAFRFATKRRGSPRFVLLAAVEAVIAIHIFVKSIAVGIGLIFSRSLLCKSSF